MISPGVILERLGGYPAPSARVLPLRSLQVSTKNFLAKSLISLNTQKKVKKSEKKLLTKCLAERYIYMRGL